MLRTVLAISAVIGFSTSSALGGHPERARGAIVVLAAVLAVAAAMNRIRFGSWLRPGWAWDIRGTGQLLEAWRASRSNNQSLLEDLQQRLAGRDVMVFGSSVQGGRFTNDHRWTLRPHGFPGGPSDVDLMIEVDMTTFAAWAAEVYGAHPVGTADDPQTACAAGCCGVVDMDGQTVHVGSYERVSVTRWPRRQAAERLLGVDFGPADVDVFLFPHEFVRGEMAIPAWDDPERSFRSEVLAGVKLADLRAGQVPLGEYFPRRNVWSFGYGTPGWRLL